MSARKKFQGQSPDFTESLLGRVPLRDRGWRKNAWIWFARSKKDST